MAYDNSSENGDMISEYLDEENNVMNPPSDAGWFFYNLIGKSLDSVSDVYNQSVLNRSPIRCNNSYLSVLGKSMGVKRDLNWSDDEYRAYLILNYYNTATIKGLEYVLNQIAIIETSEIEGYITIEQFRDNFKFSSRFKENELTSDRFITNNLLRTGKSEIVLINVPETVNIESNSEVELNINELLVSAEVYKDDFIRVRNNEVTMIFDEDYELVECYGEV